MADRAFVVAGIGICTAVIMADGKLSDQEKAWWTNAQHRMALFRDVPPAEFNDMLTRVQAELSPTTWRGLVDRWASAVPPEHRLALFEIAAELAVVDKGLDGGEPEVVRHVGKALGLPQEQIRSIFMDKIDKM